MDKIIFINKITNEITKENKSTNMIIDGQNNTSTHLYFVNKIIKENKSREKKNEKKMNICICIVTVLYIWKENNYFSSIN